jgi:hypothetical protein
VGFQSDAGVAIVEQVHEHLFEIWVRDQISEQVDVVVIHEGDRVDEKLKFVDE